MSNYTISIIAHYLIFVLDSIFSGLKIIIPLIFIAKIFKFNIGKANWFSLMRVMNILILAGSVLYLLSLITNFSLSIIRGNEDDLDFMISLLTGPHWFQFIIPVFNYGLLPNILWIRRLQESFYTYLFIILFWIVSFYVVDYFTRLNNPFVASYQTFLNISFLEFSEKTLIFISSVIIVYILVRIKIKRTAV